MKRFCSFFLSAVATAALLTSCGGGGGDSDPQKMTLKDFANGTKMIWVASGVAHSINPLAMIDSSSRLPEEDEIGKSVMVNGIYFGKYDASFTYTVHSATEFTIKLSWKEDTDHTVLSDPMVAQALGISSSIYDNGEYRSDITGLQTEYHFDQSAKVVVIESKWPSGELILPDPNPMQVPYTVVVK